MIDLNDLTDQMRTMSVRSRLYKTLKQELTARGYWKNRPRGKATKANLRKIIK